MNQVSLALTQKPCLLKRYIKKEMVDLLNIVTFITLTGHCTNEVHGRVCSKEIITPKDRLYSLAVTLWEVRSSVPTGQEITIQSNQSSKDALLCFYKTVLRAILLVAVTYLGSTVI